MRWTECAQKDGGGRYSHLVPDGQVWRYRDSFSTMTSGLLALDDWLSSHNVSQVAMESTGENGEWRVRDD